ncbi:MAG: cobalamin B12-binding domain-containing protein, partial [Desulfobacterales bacterium]|nr:cobalamin B12-binding domain-containing protein [Desulfobacterales bacterium]
MHMPSKKSVLFIHPPVSKPCEPPAGIARLSWALKSTGIDCRIYDANLEGLLHLLGHPAKAADTWTRRAVAGISGNLIALRSGSLYQNKEKYKRAVNDINRVIHKTGLAAGVHITLSNYTSPGLLPVRSSDLLRSAETFSENPFFSAFSQGISNRINQQNPDIIGLSVNFMSQALSAFAIAGYIREEFPKLRIVMGGGLISSWKKIPGFDNPFAGLVDDLVAGPGEQAMLVMCGC